MFNFFEEEMHGANKYSAWDLPCMPETLQTYELAQQAVYVDWTLLEYVRPDLITYDLCLMAVSKCGMALQYVPEHFRTEELCFLSVENTGIALQYVPEPTKEMCMIAYEQNPEAVKFFEF